MLFLRSQHIFEDIFWNLIAAEPKMDVFLLNNSEKYCNFIEVLPDISETPQSDELTANHVHFMLILWKL